MPAAQPPETITAPRHPPLTSHYPPLLDSPDQGWVKTPQILLGLLDSPPSSRLTLGAFTRRLRRISARFEDSRGTLRRQPALVDQRRGSDQPVRCPWCGHPRQGRDGS